MNETTSPTNPRRQAALAIFLASFLILFLELGLIRWIPAHVRVVSYFSNLVLLACFLGMGIGCLLVHVKWPLVRAAPFLFLLLLGMTRYFQDQIILPTVEDQQHLWLQYAGLSAGVQQFGIPVVLSFFFVAISLLFIALGHAFGQAFQRLEGLRAYSIDIVGSLAGTFAFALLSYLETPPWVWFALGGVVLAAFLNPRTLTGLGLTAVYGGACVLAAYVSGRDGIWSHYYRITSFQEPPFALRVYVNSSFHQMAVKMTPEVIRESAEIRELLAKFSLPYKYVEPKRVLILGAGTGNDVQVALMNGAQHVTAVEIDPVIARLGIERNEAKPYSHPNVRLVIDDARSFLKKTDETYDLIVFGTLDSQALLSGMSALRLENFVYTRECFEQVKQRLAPGGVAATYYSVMKPWILEKLITMQREAFGADPAVFNFNNAFLFNVILLQGGNDRWPIPPAARVSAAQAAAKPDLVPTDDWPFLYMARRAIPADNLWMIAVGLAWTVLLAGAAQVGRRPRGFSLSFFFLGAGFMLLEAKGITEMSLLFGSTWLVNVLVIGAILFMILLANLVLLRWRFERVEVFFVALAVCLLLRGLFPVESLIQTFGPLQIVLAVLRVGLPVFFAGLIFATLFSRTTAATVVLGANLVGAMAGGFSESLSLVFGLRALDWLALSFYGAAYATQPRKMAEPALAKE